MSSQIGLRFSRAVFTLVFICIAIVAVLGGSVGAQDAAPPVLSLDEAIHIAIANNRSLKIASLEVDKTKWQIAELKTKRLPSMKATVLGSQLLNEVSFTFEEGAFGNFPATGPIPDKDTKISTPRRPTVYVVGQVIQPLSQLFENRGSDRFRKSNDRQHISSLHLIRNRERQGEQT